jgi:bifunctional UDP-N-acetylglucosamine pyrophosphorylase/glucosamine-1-phosphate N-acetyltransferase
MERLFIVPAAGRGTRLGTATPKVLVPVNGRPMLRLILDLHAPFVSRAVIVADPSAAASIEVAARESAVPTTVTIQEAPTGMLDAILIGAGAATRDTTRVWVSWGDQVAVQRETLARLAEAEEGSDLALPTAEREHPYIHLDRDADGRVTRVLQRREGDVMPPVGESDIGVFSLSARACCEHLPIFARDVVPAVCTGERNFLPFIPWMAARGTVVTCACADPREAVGINTPEELAAVAAYLAGR